MTEKRKNMNRWLGSVASLLVVITTIGLYYSSVFKGERVIREVIYAVNAQKSGGSMLDSLALRSPLKEVYPEGVEGMNVDSVRLSEIESAYLRNPYVKTGKVYVDKNRRLRIDLRQRIPVVRIMSSNGADYYIDDEASAMPVSGNYSPHVMVATGRIPLLEFDQSVDSSVIHKKVFELAQALAGDEFMNSYISEIYVDGESQIYMQPLVGNFRIRINDLRDLSGKFENLKIFLKEGLSRVGWNLYSEIIVDYDNQIIGKKIMNP